jgi:hypothetical protein
MASPLIARVVIDGKQVETASLYSVFACGELVLTADPDGTAAHPLLIRSKVSLSDLPGYQVLRAPV